MTNDSLLIITPTYHERENLPEFLRRVWAAAPHAHVLIVDDASGDGTPEWVWARAEFGQTLHLVERAGKQGLGTAYVAGFAWALARDYELIVQMDADLSHDPAEIPRMVGRMRQSPPNQESSSAIAATLSQVPSPAPSSGATRNKLETASTTGESVTTASRATPLAGVGEGPLPKASENSAPDAVIASRFLGGVRVLNWPIGRLLMSIAAAHYVQWLTGLPLSDPTGGFKCFRRRALAELDWRSIRANGYAFQIEINHALWRRGVPIAEHPIIFEDRQNGSSKMSGHIALEAAWRTAWLALRSGFGVGRRWVGKSRR